MKRTAILMLTVADLDKGPAEIDEEVNIKILHIASHCTAGGTGLGTFGRSPLEPAGDRKALAGDDVGILRGEVERQPEYVPRFSR
jgi:hypothetical protein